MWTFIKHHGKNQMTKNNEQIILVFPNPFLTLCTNSCFTTLEYDEKFIS